MFYHTARCSPALDNGKVRFACQDASRPRRGPSPPEEGSLSSFDLLSARCADAGAYERRFVMSESASRLPSRPSLEQLRKQAKELIRDYRRGDSAAAERFHAIRPRPDDPSKTAKATLADAHFVLAREYGF